MAEPRIRQLSQGLPLGIDTIPYGTGLETLIFARAHPVR